MMLIEYLHFIHRAYRYRYHTERQQLKLVLSQNLRGSTVVDIGANRGIYTYWLSRLVGEKGKVYAFEPQPEMAAAIRQVAKWFSLKNVVVFQMALSSHKGAVKLGRNFPGDGGASIESVGAFAEEIVVETMSLDEIVAGENLGAIDFIKCDAEGHELKVFQGATETLRKCRPLIQVEARAEQEETKTLFELFEDFGYIGVMLLDGRFPDYRKYRSEPSRQFGLKGHRDFVFTHRSKPLELGAGKRLEV